MKVNFSTKKMTALVAGIALSSFSMGQPDNPCTPINVNGSFESNSCSFNNGQSGSAFNNGCVNMWHAGHGSPDLSQYVTNTFYPTAGVPSAADGSTFARMGTFRSSTGPRTEMIVLNGNFEPNKTYTVSFKHRVTHWAWVNSVAPLDLNIVLTNGMNNVSASGPQPVSSINFPSGSSTVYSQGGFNATQWTTETFSFTPTTSQTQLAFYPEFAGESNYTEYWAIDDIEIEECRECEVSFVQVGNIFVNTSTPSGQALGDTCCPLGFASVTWTLYEIVEYPTHTALYTSTYNTFNYTYSPTIPNATKWKVCLKVEDCSGCEGEVCSEWMSGHIVSEKSLQISTESLKVFPNPSKGIFTIELPALEEGKEGSDFQMYITNISGQKVFQTNTRQARYSISETELPQGMYLIVCQQGDQVMTEKIIIE